MDPRHKKPHKVKTVQDTVSTQLLEGSEKGQLCVVLVTAPRLEALTFHSL